eukprot:4758286-Pyramimonas_sp.AAC.1
MHAHASRRLRVLSGHLPHEEESTLTDSKDFAALRLSIQPTKALEQPAFTQVASAVERFPDLKAVRHSTPFSHPDLVLHTEMCAYKTLKANHRSRNVRQSMDFFQLDELLSPDEVAIRKKVSGSEPKSFSNRNCETPKLRNPTHASPRAHMVPWWCS